MKKRIFFLVSSVTTVKSFLIQQIELLSMNYHVTIMLNGTPCEIQELEKVFVNKDVKISSICLDRKINILKDLQALITLYRIFRDEKFEVVHSITPKAGLLGMFTALVSHIPKRVHTFTGQVWYTAKGPKRHLLKICDWVIAKCASHILVDSNSQKKFLCKNGIVSEEKSVVLGNGSISGVDSTKFFYDKLARISLRSHYGIPLESTVFLFVGRLNRDKGIFDLIKAFCRLSDKYDDCYLVLVGPVEEAIRNVSFNVNQQNKIKFIGFSSYPEKYMSMADVLCLPSYREGFGSVVIEAASVGIPAIVSNIYGLSDAVVENETGLFHQPKDILGIASAMSYLHLNKEVRQKMGHQAHKRAIDKFDSHILMKELLDFYEELLLPPQFGKGG